METENISTNEEGLSSGSVDVEPPAITSAFQVDRNQIESIALENQPEELRALGIVAYDQSTFEEGILQQVDDALEKQNKLKKQNVAQPKKVRKETEKQKLIRLGQITPFGTAVSGGGTNVSTSLERYLQEQERLKEQKKQENGKGKALKRTSSFTSPAVITTNSLTPQSKEARKNKKSSTSTSRKRNSSDDEYIPEKSETKSSKKRKISTSSFGSKDLDLEDDDGDVTYYQTDDSDWESESEVGPASSKRKKKSGRVIDDGNVNDYQERLAKWKATCGPREEIPCHELEGGYRIPLSVWDSLYNYQKVGVQWMWELRLQRCGGILGDEMGLGKTIQAVAFLAGLSHCRIITRQSSYSGLGPVLLVAPTTVMHQWTKEFHKWWPPFRVAILHESGSHSGSRQSLIRSINAANGVLITSYTGVVSNSESLLGLDWDYIILDEGHKIRNPDAQATLVLKQFRTSNRFILSGSPMQNNLKELWSLVDFVFPGKLGTLPVFIQQFSVPITQGGYSNASQVQVATAYKCATVLKRTIEPYLLRRMKADVKDHLSLPDKNEQVLFCRLTSEQREMYQSYLDSGEIKNIVDGRLQIFVGLTKLRKICNHPDLFDKKQAEHSDKSCVERSGKMVVVESLLRIWKDQQHRCLLFSQSKKMLDMLETFVRKQNYSYLRMDGTTSIGSRHPMVEKFNQSEDIFVFLLTTRVGGLGVNLTGANRVIIYDPDWNPSTDTQARERSWRIGQKKDVTIYRLLTSGTIEEKIYHRQIFKQYLTNRVLNDPKQRRFFKSNDLYELFTLKETDSQCTETEAIFAGTSSDVSTTNPYGGESGRGGDRKQLAKSTDDEWMRQWKKEKEKREAEWKKKVEKEKRKAELKALNETEEEKRIRKKRESKERKEKRQVKVDGGRVKNAIKVTSYRPSEADTAADETSVDSSSSSQQNNDYVLKSLFAKTGVMSALQHDRIIDAGNPDYALIEGEAERVAQQAIRELKSSRRRECWTAADGVPTWTGTSGGVRPLSGNKPRFGAKKRNPIAHSTSSENTTVTAGQVEPSSNQSSAPSAAPSSSDLLNRMSARNRLLGVPGSAPPPDDDDESYLGQAREEENLIHQSTPVPLEFATGVDYRSMMDEVRSFVAFRGVVPGQVSTSDLLNEFNGNLPSRGAPLFRALLKQLCNFTRNVHGDGIWQLKPEFQ